MLKLPSLSVCVSHLHQRSERVAVAEIVHQCDAVQLVLRDAQVAEVARSLVEEGLSASHCLVDVAEAASCQAMVQQTLDLPYITLQSGHRSAIHSGWKV